MGQSRVQKETQKHSPLISDEVASETKYRKDGLVLFPNNCFCEMQYYTEERKSTSTLRLVSDAEVGKYNSFRGQEEIFVIWY